MMGFFVSFWDFVLFEFFLLSLFLNVLLLLVEVNFVMWNFSYSILQNVVFGFLRNQLRLLCSYEQLLDSVLITAAFNFQGNSKDNSLLLCYHNPYDTP